MRMRLPFIAFAVVATRLLAGGLTYSDSVAPVLERSCVKCHGEKKQKAGLRLDSVTAILRGSDDGSVAIPGHSFEGELVRRITLPRSDEEAMPSGNEPPLTEAEISAIEGWIGAGLPEKNSFQAAIHAPPPADIPTAPDYRLRLKDAIELARKLGVTLVPRSQNPTDGLILRTASSPKACNDRVLEGLRPVGDLIVEAELARTQVTDQGLAVLSQWQNLARIDLTRTSVTLEGISALSSLKHLDAVNLTETRVKSPASKLSRVLPSVRRIWCFDGS